MAIHMLRTLLHTLYNTQVYCQRLIQIRLHLSLCFYFYSERCICENKVVREHSVIMERGWQAWRAWDQQIWACSWGMGQHVFICHTELLSNPPPLLPTTHN